MSKISLNRKILLIVLSFAIVSQFVYLYISVLSFRSSYHEVVRSNLVTVGETVKGNLDYILDKGIEIDSLVGLEGLFGGVLKDVPELHSVAVQDNSGRWLYYCSRKEYLEGKKLDKRVNDLQLNKIRKEFALSFRLASTALGDLGIKGKLLLIIDRKLINKRVRDIALDSGTVILISILIIIDFLFFLITYTIVLPIKNTSLDIEQAQKEGWIDMPVRRTGIDFIDSVLDAFDKYRNSLKDDWLRLEVLSKYLTRTKDWQGEQAGNLDGPLNRVKEVLNRFRMMGDKKPKLMEVGSPVLVRPAIFLYVFSGSLSISFLPLYAKDLYLPLWNLSEDFIIGLPIAAFMLCTALGFPIGGAWSDMIGRKRAFLLGAILGGAGLLLSGIAPNILMLIAYRMLEGIGFGVVMLTSQAYIIDTTTEANRGEGMAMHLTAFYGGTLCGSAIGGMLADRVGYRIPFFFGAVVAIFSMVFLYFFVTEQSPTTDTNSTAPRPKVKWTKKLLQALPSPHDFKRLFADRNFAALALCQSIPNKIILIGYVYYAAPLLLKQLGNSQSDAGRYIMGYSLMMILLSQAVSKWSDRRNNTFSCIIWGGTLSGLALIPLFFFNNTFTVAIGIILLGLFHALSVSNQAKLASELKVVNEIGIGPGLGLYRQVERLGNVVAPLLMGGLTAALGYSKSIALLGVITAGLSLLFMVIYRDETTGR